MPANDPTESLQRVNFFAFIPSLIKTLGGDPSGPLALAGLDAPGMMHPESVVPLHKLGLLLQAAAEETKCPHFGLELGKLIKPRTLGPVGELVRHAATLRHAVRIFAAHQHRNSHGIVNYLIEHEDHAFLGFAVYATEVTGVPLLIDCTAMGMFTSVMELVDGAAPFMEVSLSRSRPENVALYKRLFGVKLHFNAEQTAIRLPTRLLDQPIRGADPKTFRELEARVQNLWHVGVLSPEVQLRRELRAALLTGQSTAPEVAKQLGMNTRTLHRRLATSGLNFQHALDEARCEFAKQLLANTELEIGTVGLIVGYSEPSVLTRSFTNWTGASPSVWRKRLTTSLHKAELHRSKATCGKENAAHLSTLDAIR